MIVITTESIKPKSTMRFLSQCCMYYTCVCVVWHNVEVGKICYFRFSLLLIRFIFFHPVFLFWIFSTILCSYPVGTHKKPTYTHACVTFEFFRIKSNPKSIMWGFFPFFPFLNNVLIRIFLFDAFDFIWDLLCSLFSSILLLRNFTSSRNILSAPKECREKRIGGKWKINAITVKKWPKMNIKMQ